MKKLAVSLAAGVVLCASPAQEEPTPAVPQGGSLWLCFLGQALCVLTSQPDPVASVVHTDGVVCFAW